MLCFNISVRTCNVASGLDDFVQESLAVLLMRAEAVVVHFGLLSDLLPNGRSVFVLHKIHHRLDQQTIHLSALVVLCLYFDFFFFPSISQFFSFFACCFLFLLYQILVEFYFFPE